MTKTRPTPPPAAARYGRCPMCGDIVCQRGDEALTVPEKAWPTASTVARHLREDHRIPQVTLDGHLTKEHIRWHEAEHATRTPATSAEGVEKGRHAGHLRHTHPARTTVKRGRAA